MEKLMRKRGEASQLRQTPPLLIQPRLAIGPVDDPYEREAERVADKVMRMPAPAIQRAPLQIQRCGKCAKATRIEDMCPSCAARARANGLLQRDSAGAVLEVTPEVETNISAMHGSGQPLDTGVRAFMEPRFGHDFSNVRVHTDARAASTAAAVNALAFTVGQDVVFGAGQYHPGTDAGKRLLAHELTHVVQQGGSNSSLLGRKKGSLKPTPQEWNRIHKYKYPGSTKVRITLFRTNAVKEDPSSRYISVASKILKEHDLTLDVYKVSQPLDYDREITAPYEVLDVRMLAHEAYQDVVPRLPVIVCPYHMLDKTEAEGLTEPSTDWLPFVLINSLYNSSDGVALLHEIGHAAKVPGVVDVNVGQKDAVENFMLYGNNRTDMTKSQVLAIAHSYFAR